MTFVIAALDRLLALLGDSGGARLRPISGRDPGYLCPEHFDHHPRQFGA